MLNKRAKNYRTSIQTDASSGKSDTTRSLHVRVILRDSVNEYQRQIYADSIYRQLCGYGPDPKITLEDEHALDINLEGTVLTESELKKKILWNEFVKEIEKVFPIDNEDEGLEYLEEIKPLASKKHADVEPIGESVPMDAPQHSEGPGECLECQKAHQSHGQPKQWQSRDPRGEPNPTAAFWPKSPQNEAQWGHYGSEEFTSSATDEEADDFLSWLPWSVD